MWQDCLKIEYNISKISLRFGKREVMNSGGVQPIIKRKVVPSEFIVKDSDVVGGEVTRAMAYDE